MNLNKTQTTELTEHEKLIQARNVAREKILKDKNEPEIEWLTDNSRKFLESGYLTGDTTPEERIREIADNAERILNKPGFSDKFYKYMAAGFFSLASPIWSNFGKKRGLPISCFGSHVADDMGDILFSQSEVGMMSKLGGGTSGYFGKLRERGADVKNNGSSSGSVHIMQLFEKMVDVVSQGSVRRGRFSPYLPIDHPDIKEFLEIGTEGNPIQELTHGVTVGNDWMQEMIDGDVEKRSIWAKILQRRGEIGYPYILFRDNANNGTVDVYKDKKHEIYASNLCTEIMLPSNDEWSFVCCLSSQNMLFFDDWKDTDATEVLTKFLYAVYEDFIAKAKDIPFMEKAVKFAREHKSIGVGLLGLHSYLQSKMIAFESLEAKMISSRAAKHLNDHTLIASKELAKKFGEPKLLEGYGEMFTTRCAIAPTTSSSFILGQVSPSIELLQSNYFIKDLAKGKYTYKNPYLEKLLEEKGKNSLTTWRSIMKNTCAGKFDSELNKRIGLLKK